MSAIPSIVAGLFIYAAFILALRPAAVGLRGRARALGPDAADRHPHRRGRAAARARRAAGGVARARRRRMGDRAQVVLPTARAGLLTAVILGDRPRRRRDRAAARSPRSATRRTTRTRSTASRTRCRCSSTGWSAFPQTASIQRAWTGALVLLVIVLVLFVDRPHHRRPRPRPHRTNQAPSPREKGTRMTSPTRSTLETPRQRATVASAGAGDARRADVSAWFGDHKVLERVSLDMRAEHGDRADRPVGLRQVDVPADPQPDARAGAGRVAGRHGRARRHRHLPVRAC